MNVIHMFAVLLLLSLAVTMTLPLYGIDVTYTQAFVALAGIKAIALFLVPEKAPIIMVNSRKEIEEED